METRLIEYEFTKGAKDMVGSFHLAADHGDRWWKALAEFQASDEENVCDFFMAQIEAGKWSGSEIMAFALAGFKAPVDMERIMMAPMLRMMGGDKA